MTKVTICASMTQCNDVYNDTDHTVDDFKSLDDNDEVDDDNDDDDDDNGDGNGDDNGDDNGDGNGDGNAFSWPSSRPSLSAPPLSCEQDCPPSWKYDDVDEKDVDDEEDDVDEEDDDRNRIPRLFKPEDRSRPLVDDMACHHLNISS